MQIIDNLIILSLIVIAFIAGLKVAGHYYSQMVSMHEYTEKIMASEKGFGYIAHPGKHMPIGENFMDRLKTNGRATQVLRKSQT